MNKLSTIRSLTKAGILGLIIITYAIADFNDFNVQLIDLNNGGQFEVKFIPASGYSYPVAGGLSFDSVNAPSVITFIGIGWVGRMIAKRSGFVSDTVDTIIYPPIGPHWPQPVNFNLKIYVSVKGPSIRENLFQKSDLRKFNVAGRLLNKKVNAGQIIMNRSLPFINF